MSYPPLYISIFFMLLTVVLAITHLQASLPELIISLLFWSGLFSVGLYCGWQNAKLQRPIFEQIGNGIAIIAILVFIATYFARGLTFALIGFLIWIQAARNFTLSTSRDFYFAITLSFFLLLYAASQSKSGIFLLFMVAYVLAGTFALVANYLETRRQQAQNQSEMLVLKTRTFLTEGVGLATMIVFVATLLYLFVPRPPATHFGAFVAGGMHYYENEEWQAEAQDESNDVETNEESEELDDSQENGLDNEEGNSQGETLSEKEIALSEGTSPFSNQFFNRDIFAYEGFQKSCDIQKTKQSRQSNDIVLYLQAEQPLYLRGEVFDTFNNHNWTKHFSDDKKLALEYDKISFGDEMNNDGVSQIITLNKNMSSGTLFAAETVKMLRFPASVIARNNYGTLQAPSSLRKGTVYSVKSYFEMIKDHPASGAELLDDPAPYLQFFVWCLNGLLTTDKASL